MMSSASEVLISAPTQQVFDAFTDLRNTVSRLSGVSAVEILAENPAGVGTLWRETRIVLGAPVSQIIQVETVDAPNGFSIRADNNGVICNTHFAFIPEGTATRVRATFSVIPATFAAMFFSPALFMVATVAKSVLDRDLLDMKRAIESGA
ncbi:MAG: SRPBCC family protein [Chitinophagales bacterium]|nr:SRPBCC family protein [Hyphomicrobiales bacterium]